ncbi:MAG: hypothetical protein QW801_05800, partial [Candidatus Caldarchaeum sp.]
EMAWLQQRQSSAPNTPVTVYVPFKNPLTPDETQAILQSNDLRLVKWYGYLDKSARERDWLTGEGTADISNASRIYAVDVSATPEKLLKLSTLPEIIVIMPRS